MKTKFQIKQILMSTMAIVMALSTVFSCQKDYDDDIKNLEDSIKNLQEAVKNLTYVKSITMSDKGVLTITPSTGSAISYDARNYVKYSIEVKNGNEIYVNGEKVGTITVDVADPTLSVVNNELLVNGKSQNPKIMLPEAASTTPCVSIIKDKDGKIVSVTLKDGENEYVISTSSALTSLVFIPEVVSSWYDSFENQVAIDFFYAKKAEYAQKFDKNYYTEVESRANVWGYILPKYRVNPSNVDITKVDWSMATRLVELKSANGDLNVFEVKSVEKYGDCAIAAKAVVADEKAWYDAYDSTPRAWTTIALRGTTKNNDGDPVEVYSDAAAIVEDEHVVELANKVKTVNAADGKLINPAVIYTTDVESLKNDAVEADHKVAYDAKDVDLMTYVLAVVQESATTKALSDFNYDDFDYKFESVSYIGSDGVTDQSYFVKLDGSKFTPCQGTAGINRKPIFYAQVFDKTSGNILAEGYIKFQIEKEVAPVEQPKHEIDDIAVKTFNYNEMFDGTTTYETNYSKVAGYTWKQMNDLYNKLGLDHNTFKTVYTGATVETVINGDNTKYGKAAKFVYDFENVNVDTYAMSLDVTPYSKFGENTAVTTITPSDKTKPILVIKWKWNVVKPVLTLDVVEGYRYNGSTTTAATKGMNTATGYQMQMYFGEAYNYAPALNKIFGNAEAKKVNGSTFDLVLAKDYADKKITMDGTPYGDVETGVTGKASLAELFGTTTGEGVLLGLGDKLKETQRSYDLNFIVHYINGEDDELTRTVVFINPIEIKQVKDNELVDLVNGNADEKDFAVNYDVYFNGKLMVKGGVAQDGTNNTIKAADFVDVTAADYGAFFELVNADPVTYRDVTKSDASNAKDGKFQWKNAGTKLQSPVVAAYVTYTFKTSFSEASIVKSNITVKPE